jgi:hypothetical protein
MADGHEEGRMKRMISVLVALIVAAGASHATAQTAATQKSGASMAAKKAQGVVSAVTSDSVTVKAAGKDMMFSVDSSTKVVAKGAGTKSEAAGGKMSITDAVGMGDRVTVSYHDMDGKMHASEVRVTAKATHK